MGERGRMGMGIKRILRTAGLIPGVVLLALILLSPRIIFAHAVLLESVPAAGSLTAGPAITVQLRFNSRVDGKRSRVVLVTPDGKTYPLDIAPQTAADTLNAPAKRLLKGNYKLQWQVLAADGHITRGEFPFAIQ